MSGPGTLTGSGPNESASKTLDRILRRNQGGFYFLIASPRAQAAAVEPYRDGNYAVYDFALQDAEGRRLIQLARLLEREPDRTAYILLNFQLALWDGDARDGLGDWNVDAMRRLNFARDELIKRDRNLVFCMTGEADDQLNRRAMDFYDYVKLFVRFEDVEERPAAAADVRPVDRSVGVDVKVDFSQDEERLLAQAIALGNQAVEMYEAFRYADALHLFEKQREIREQILGEKHPDTAKIYYWIGYVYYDMGKYERAVEWFQKALAVQEEVLGKEHLDTAWTYNSLGVAYENMGDYARALEWKQKALVVFEKVQGSNHPDTAKVYGNLGIVYKNMGDYTRALEWHKKALAVEEKALGKNHPDTALTYNNLSVLYAKMGEYAQSLKWNKKALAVKEKVLGKEHPDTATSYENFGAQYANTGDYLKALEWYQKALAVREKVLGKEHPHTALVYNDLATVYEKLGNHPMAQQYRKKAEDAQKDP